MKRRYLNLLFIGLAFIFTACGGDKGNEGTDTPKTGGEEEVAKEEVKPEAPTEQTAVCLWPSAISIHAEADPKSKYLTSVSLGEKVSYLGEDKEENKRVYSKVKLTDGSEGWARKDFFGIDAKAVAISSDATIYKRPDLLSKTSKSFSKMDVIAVLSTKEDWLEVKGKHGTWFTEGWIKKSNITEAELDVVVAAFYTKAKMQEGEKQRKALQEIVDNSDFSGSMFIEAISEELTAEPTPEEGDGDMVEEDSTSVDGGE